VLEHIVHIEHIVHQEILHIWLWNLGKRHFCNTCLFIFKHLTKVLVYASWPYGFWMIVSIFFQ